MQVKSIIAILSALIKLPFVIKSFVLSIFELQLKTSFTVLLYPSDANQENFKVIPWWPFKLNFEPPYFLLICVCSPYFTVLISTMKATIMFNAMRCGINLLYNTRNHYYEVRSVTDHNQFTIYKN